MIAATLENIVHQALITPRIEKALEFLRQLQRTDIADGRYEIDGTEIFAIVQSYETKPDKEHPKFEAHRKYIDLQYILSGKERFGWAPIAKLESTTSYQPEKDILYGTVAAEDAGFVTLSAGEMILVYPWDAHAPGLALETPTPVRKMVIKIQHLNIDPKV